MPHQITITVDEETFLPIGAESVEVGLQIAKALENRAKAVHAARERAHLYQIVGPPRGTRPGLNDPDYVSFEYAPQFFTTLERDGDGGVTSLNFRGSMLVLPLEEVEDGFRAQATKAHEEAEAKEAAEAEHARMRAEHDELAELDALLAKHPDYVANKLKGS